MESTKRTARRAGLLYLALALTAPLGLMIVPERIYVAGNAAATAENLRAAGWLLRVGIASELTHQIISVLLVLTLYRLFKAVNQGQAVLLVVMSLLPVPIVFLNILNEVAALTLVGGAGYLSVFDRPQLEALALLFMRLHGQGITIASVFWGLWLFPFGWLTIRSGFIPRVFGYLLWAAGVGYLAAAFASLVVPWLSPAVGPVAMVLEFAEVPIIFWLAIWGARELRPAAAGPARSGA